MSRYTVFAGVLLGLALENSVSGDTIQVPDDFTTIQAAIDAASDGCEIIVAPGTYVENINFLGQDAVARPGRHDQSFQLDSGLGGGAMRRGQPETSHVMRRL